MDSNIKNDNVNFSNNSEDVLIKLNTLEDVKSFVNITSMCDFDIDLSAGRYVVDAKSIMGIFSLDLTKNIKLRAHTNNKEKFFDSIKKYIVS